MTSVDFEVTDDNSSEVKPVFDKYTTIEWLIRVAIADGTYKDPYAGINFVEFNPIIKDRDGKVIFDEKVIFPDYFRDNDVIIVASKYLANQAKAKETDLRQMIDRVANTITNWGISDGYFDSQSEALEFNYKLKYYQIHQYFSFNSPVYFNIGLYDEPALSACFITSIEDNMDSITNLYARESRLFKGGSGNGCNFSHLRSSRERVRGGGFASGATSFLKASDVCAGIVKSGGTLRRAAKMACLNIDHPDILDFINCKDREEEKLRILKEAGFKPAPGMELSDEVFFQNTNLSVRLTDDFMQAVKNNGVWHTREVLTGKIVDTFKARDLLMIISEHAWKNGDPGVMFHDNINAMNTVPDEGVIEASNPCGEWNFLNETPCNLSSFNAIKFFSIVDGEVKFDENMFEDVIRVMITSQDMFCDHSSFPDEIIRKNAKRYRTIGAGFTNIAALCMYLGYPYDSVEARSLVSTISSLMTATAYKISAELSDKLGTAEWWDNEKNRESIYKVINIHKKSADDIFNCHIDVIDKIKQIGCTIWKDLVDNKKALRAASVTLSQPTGTTGYLKSIESFGPEPFFSLISYKTLSGNDGAVIKLVSDTPKLALKNLGYDDTIIDYIITDLVENDIPIENSKWICPEHIPIFDTALAPANGKRFISYMGHVNMLAAIQPFISSAISKTINMANNCTVEDIFNLYCYTWEKGLKSITVYRDGSRSEQVLNTKKKEEVSDVVRNNPDRRKMPTDRDAKIHKFTINGNIEGYLTCGQYPSGELGEIFITLSKDTPTLRGWADALATITSLALQSGVSLELLVNKMIRRRFAPAGFTSNVEIRNCNSIIDYIFRFIAFKYLTSEQLDRLNLVKTNIVNETNFDKEIIECPICSTELVKRGTCFSCSGCGFSTGSCD